MSKKSAFLRPEINELRGQWIQEFKKPLQLVNKGN